jgi:hypothetical protein
MGDITIVIDVFNIGVIALIISVIMRFFLRKVSLIYTIATPMAFGCIYCSIKGIAGAIPFILLFCFFISLIGIAIAKFLIFIEGYNG